MSAVKFREILRLTWRGIKVQQVSDACGCARSTVQDYIGKALVSGLTSEQAEAMSDSELLERLGKKIHREEGKIIAIDWKLVGAELIRPGMTLQLLWKERFSSIEDKKECVSYSVFCRRYRKWCEKNHQIPSTLRQIHYPGEKSFVDFSGLKLTFCNIKTGEIFEAEIFVGCLGASNLTYVEAASSQRLECWLGAHVRMFTYFGGVTKVVVPDNLKSGVTKACRYEPSINRAYVEFAEHYDTAVIPARANKPKDKAKVEKAVQDIQHWILAPLRDVEFHSVGEINAAIMPLLKGFNEERILREYGISRRALFEQNEEKLLQPLPRLPFEFAIWKTAKVNIDYHIEYERHYYSVPYYLVRKEVEIRVTEKLVNVFFEHACVTFHVRSREQYKHTTLFEHMPPEHQAVRSWSKDKFISWSKSVGSETALFVETLFAHKPHPEQAFRAILGLQRLASKYTAVRLESACKRANCFNLKTMGNIRSILETSKDKIELTKEDKTPLPQLHHANLRGSTNFH